MGLIRSALFLAPHLRDLLPANLLANKETPIRRCLLEHPCPGQSTIHHNQPNAHQRIAIATDDERVLSVLRTLSAKARTSAPYVVAEVPITRNRRIKLVPATDENERS